VFTVGPGSGLPPEYLVPVVEPADIDGDQIRPARRWAIVTTRGVEPPPVILAHLDRMMGKMPPRGDRRTVRWLPPEPFTGKRPLPLPYDAVLVPRIATHLKAVRLPAGRLPVNHDLVILSSTYPVERLLAMLADPAVQAQADVLADPIDGGYRSYTATLLRQLTIPRHLLEATHVRRDHDR